MSLSPELFHSEFPDGPQANLFQPGHWNRVVALLEALLDDSDDATGSLLYRDNADATDGASWLAPGAVGTVLAGTGSAPAFTASPSLTSLTLSTPLGAGSGGTGSAFFAASGPSAARTFTFPDANATILTTNAAVTVPQGGTGLTGFAAIGAIPYASSTSALSALAAASGVLTCAGSGQVPAWSVTPTLTDLTLTGALKAAAGTVGTPAITRSGDLNTGFYFPSDDQIAISTGGTGRAMFDGSGNFRPVTDNTGSLGTSAARWTSGFLSTSLTFGAVASAATLGFVRAPNNMDIAYARNAAGNGDLLVLTTTGANAIRLGGTGVSRVEAKADDGIKVLLNSAAASRDAFWFTADNEAHFAGYVYSDQALVNPEFLAYRGRGTIASPSAVQADDRLGLYSGWGWTPTAGFKEVGQVNILAASNFTDTSTTWKGYIQFRMRNSSDDTFYERARITELGNLLIGTTAAGTSAASVIGIANGTEPSTSPADMVQLYSVDLSAGNATLGIRTETAVATESVTSDRTLSIRINGTTYKVLLKA